MFKKYKQYQFLFEELVKRDFSIKYKRTILGIFWSVLSPLLTLLVMRLVFTQFFGRDTPYYTTYLFAGNLVFSYYKDATTNGMKALVGNKDIITKVKMPQYMFVFSTNVSSLINFLITLVVFFAFTLLDGIAPSFRYLALIYPTLCLLVLNIGVGLVLSALYVFFRDMQYLYNIFTLLLMYMSAIFYQVDKYAENIQRLFLLNPVYVCIKYFRVVVIDGTFPSLFYHLLMFGYAAIVMLIGFWIYRRNNQRFLYYM
ncbi:MAG TPA: ABC transporter permease [Candidatus Limiplasma sp.]|nr:ABC transporter permease [Candidatus Limiplasma sp.]